MANFFVKTVTVSMFYQAVSQWHSLHFELLIELVAQKLTELWRLKIWSIFWSGDLVPWPTYLSMSHTGTAHPFYMWTKFGDDMSKRSWVMLDKTDRQTDRQTDERAIGDCVLAKICWSVCETETNFWYPVQFHTFWAFDRFSSSNIDRAIAVQSFDLFVALMTSSEM